MSLPPDDPAVDEVVPVDMPAVVPVAAPALGPEGFDSLAEQAKRAPITRARDFDSRARRIERNLPSGGIPVSGQAT